MATKDIALILSFDDKGTVKVRRVVGNVTRELTKLEKKAINTGRGFKKLEKDVEKSAKGMEKFKGMLKSTAVQMAAGMGIMMGVQGAVRGITRAVTDFVNTGRTFEREWANVTTMLSISEQATEDMKNELISLSPTLGSVTEMAKGMYQVLSASVEPAKAIEFLGVAAKAAVAGVTDVFTSVDALTTVINAYGMAAEDATAVSDIMFQTVKRGKLTFGELASALGTVVPTAAQLGIRFEEIAAGMATLTRQGINVNTATMQLRQVMMSVLKPSEDAAKLAEKLGIEFSAAGLKAKGLSNFLAELAEKTEGDVTLMGKFFSNIRALSAVFGLAGKSAADFAYDIELMGSSAGSTEEAFQKQMKTLDFWIKTATHALEDMKVAFYEGMVGPIREIISSQEQLDEVFESLTSTAKQLGAVLGLVGKVFKLVQPLIDDELESIANLDKTVALFIETTSRGLIPMYSDMLQKEWEALVSAGRLAEAETKLAKNIGGVWGQIAVGAEWWKRQIDYYIDSGISVDEYIKKLSALRRGTADFQVQTRELQAVQDLGLQTQSKLKQDLTTLMENIELAAASDVVFTKQLESHIKAAIRLAEVTGQYLSPVVRQLAIDLGLVKTTAQLLEEIKITIIPPSDSIPDMLGYEEAQRQAKEADKANKTYGQTLIDLLIPQGTIFGLTLEQIAEGYRLNALDAEKAAKAEKWEERTQKAEEFAEKVRAIGDTILMAVGGIDRIFNQMFQNNMQRIENEYQARKQAIDESMISDQEKYFAIEKLDREMDKKRLAAKRKQAVAAKLTGVMEATVHTAVAVTEAYPDIPLAVIIAALGALQIAFIAAQPLPSFAEGGIAGLRGPEVILVGEKGPERITPLSKEGKGAANIEFNANFIISSPDALGVRDFVRDRAGPEFIEWVKLNKTDLLEALELV